MLTLSVILESLTGFQLCQRPNSKLLGCKFPDVTLVALADATSIGEGWLHVGSPAQSRRIVESHPEIAVLCACSSDDEVEQASAIGGNCVVLRTDETADRLFVEVRAIFRRIRDWLTRIHVIYQENGGYDDVLKASEDVIGNFITISDSAYRLLAYTDGLTTTDAVQRQLVENGCHLPDTIQEFNRLNLPEQWRTAPSIEVVEQSPICAFPTVAYVYRFRHNYFVHIVMLCEQRVLTDGIVDLFGMLVDALAPFVRRDWDARKGFAQPHDQLIERLLSNEGISESALAIEATLARVPLVGAFKLFCIEAAEIDSLGVDNIAWRLVEQLPSFRISIYQDLIIALFVGDLRFRGDDNVSPQFLDKLFIGQMPVHVGVSRVYSKLSESAFAYRQALIALRFACSSTVGHCPRSQTSMIVKQFDDYLIDYLLRVPDGDAPFFEFCLRVHPLMKILDEDRARGTREFDILMTYIRAERKATMAAAKLHMHRNNVLYHVGRIVERHGLDLDDANTRFEILAVARFIEGAEREDSPALPSA